MHRRLILALFFFSLAMFGQLVTVTETLGDGTPTGYLQIQNPTFLSPVGSAGAITGATNATPIVVTRVGHGFLTGQTILALAFGGNTAPNNRTWVIIRLDADTFSLNGSVGNGTWTVGGTVQRVILVPGGIQRYPATAGVDFVGTVTVSLYPTTNALSVPTGSPSGFSYRVELHMLSGGTRIVTTQRWNVPTSGPVTIQDVLVQGATTPATFTTVAPLPVGAAAAGTANVAARVDHVHGAGIPVNAQTGTSYAVLDADRGKLITLSNTSAVAATIPQAGATSFTTGWAAWLLNLNTGVVTLTPTTSTVDGQTMLVLRQYESALLVSNGTNYFSTKSNSSNASLIQFKGANVASATTMTLTAGNLFHVTGTTTVTTLNPCDTANAGRSVVLIFDGVLTFTDGSNLKLAGNFVTTADDTITLVCDGSNWFEGARAVN